jgi:hypothetical protein
MISISLIRQSPFGLFDDAQRRMRVTPEPRIGELCSLSSHAQSRRNLVVPSGVGVTQSSTVCPRRSPAI